MVRYLSFASVSDKVLNRCIAAPISATDKGVSLYLYNSYKYIICFYSLSIFFFTHNFWDNKMSVYPYVRDIYVSLYVCTYFDI